MADIIKVTFLDGTEYCYKSPVNTVLAVLRKIGEEKFPSISLMRGKNRIVSQSYSPEIKKYIREIIPGWYYFNQSDTREKTSQLININRQFDIDMKIEVGNFKGEANPRIEGTTKHKNRLVVTMPNGDVIDHESYRQVFVDCIYKLGPRKVSAASVNINVSKNRDLFSTTNSDGNRFKLDETLYVEMPYTSKDAMKYLKIIGSSLRVNLRIEFTHVE